MKMEIILACLSIVILFILLRSIESYRNRPIKHKHNWEKIDWNVEPIGIKTELGVWTTNYKCKDCPETYTTKETGFI